MISEKSQLVINVVNTIRDAINNSVFAGQPLAQSKSQEDITDFLRISNPELVAIVTFVTDVLPEKLYLQKYNEVNDYAIGLISKELILFLVQEDKNSDYFKNNLENFRDEMLGTILGDVYLDDNDKLVVERA